MKYEVTVESDRSGAQSTIEVDVAKGESIADAIHASGKIAEAWNLLDVVAVTWDEPDDEPLPADPRFPDRPTHPDFARLSSAVMQQDAVADMLGIREAANVDFESLTYLAQHRIHAAIGGVPVPTWLMTTMGALYFDAFTLGVGFTERGGHRPAETGNPGEKEGSL